MRLKLDSIENWQATANALLACEQMAIARGDLQDARDCNEQKWHALERIAVITAQGECLARDWQGFR